MKRKYNKKNKKLNKFKPKYRKSNIYMHIHFSNMKDKIFWLKFVKEIKLTTNKKYQN